MKEANANVMYMLDRNYSGALAILEELKLQYPEHVNIYSTLRGYSVERACGSRPMKMLQRSGPHEKECPKLHLACTVCKKPGHMPSLDTAY